MATNVSSRKAPGAKHKSVTPKNGLKSPSRARKAPAHKTEPEHEFKRIVPALPLQEFLEGLTAIGDAIPEDVRSTIPPDYSQELDHYLYGVPKQVE